MLVLKPHQLTVLTTSKCTARCEHCCMHSGPNRRERLAAKDVIKVVDELHGLNRLRVVIFAGGEPTLLKGELLEAISHCDSLGILTRLVTNASWAVSAVRTKEMLHSLREAGLSELNISADDYHLPYVPFENVSRAWHASKRMGFVSVVIANCAGPRSTVTPAFIMKRLDEILPTRYDEKGHAKQLPPFSDDGTMYMLSNANVQRVGRGLQGSPTTS